MIKEKKHVTKHWKRGNPESALGNASRGEFTTNADVSQWRPILKIKHQNCRNVMRTERYVGNVTTNINKCSRGEAWMNG